MATSRHEFIDALGRQEFLGLKKNADKLLYVLAAAYEQRREEFETVLKIRHGTRVFFARNPIEIERSGRGTSPRNIPGTPFWVLTKSSSDAKQKLLRDALGRLRFSEAAINAATAVIAKRPDRATIEHAD